MAIAYTWQFDFLDVYPTYQTVNNAVESMHWRLTADDGVSHHSHAYGNAKAGPIDVNNFIPYANLTLPVVQGWCEAAIGSQELDAIKASLAGQIDEQALPTISSMLPPWS